MLSALPPILRAIIYMVVGMFFFMLGDLYLKLASQHLPLGQYQCCIREFYHE